MHKKIINSCLLVGALLLFSFHRSDPGFKAAQLRSARVKAAYRQHWAGLQALLASKNIHAQEFDLYLRAFKQESTLEIWAKNKNDVRYTLLQTVAICAKSGSLGPKRRQGDGQVPEGFYSIESFNPYSSYHLSLKVGYPNKSDALKASGNPGGDIMIHGYCVTIGCIPIQNEPIEKLYVLCVEAKNRNSAIYADIYPFHFSAANETLVAKASEETQQFWGSLKKAYAYFEQNHCRPKISTDKKGNYILENTAP